MSADSRDEERSDIDLFEVNRRLAHNGDLRPKFMFVKRLWDTPTPIYRDAVSEWEYWYAHDLELERKAYQNLLRDGGRPTHDPDDWGPKIMQAAEGDEAAISYWMGPEFDACLLLRHQDDFWRDFRKWQDRFRGKFSDRIAFDREVVALNDFRRGKGLSGTAQCKWNRSRQRPLDDWLELQWYQYRNADRFAAIRDDWNEKTAQCESELERLIKDLVVGSERESTEKQLAVWRDRLREANREIKRHRYLLNWIDTQVAAIEREGSTSLLARGSISGAVSSNTRAQKRKRAAEKAVKRVATRSIRRSRLFKGDSQLRRSARIAERRDERR